MDTMNSINRCEVMPEVRARLELPPHTYINGRRQAPRSEQSLDVLDPGSGEVISKAARGNSSDIDDAVKAAHKAMQPGSPWRQMSALDRGKVLAQIGALIERNLDALTQLEVLDAGKVWDAAKAVDVTLAARHFHYYSGWPSKIEGATIPVAHPNTRARTERMPVGVVAQILPWNFPLLLGAWKIAPALAAGCAIVVKPSEETPLSLLWLAELATQAGLPDGVLNIVPGLGSEAGEALVKHPLVNKIAFTGSTAVGIQLARTAALQVKSVSLELGGKSPLLVFDDADLDSAAAGAAGGIFWHSGQVCSAASRLYVQKAAYDGLVERLQEAVRRLRIGHGLKEGTDLGPLVNKKQVERVSGYIQRAETQGATVFRGEELIGEAGGFYCPATLLTNIDNSMESVQEEIFGPVLAVQSFDTFEQGLELANDTKYGLAAGIWTNSIRTAERAASELRAGTVYINGWGYTDAAVPFGGVQQSGYGRDMGKESVDAYLSTKSIWTIS